MIAYTPSNCQKITEFNVENMIWWKSSSQAFDLRLNIKRSFTKADKNM